MIQLKNISREFQVGDETVHALRNVNLEIEAGDHVALMGPSGSGKSTLLNVIGCLDRPSTGTYILEGKDVTHMEETELSLIRRHRIGFVFQFFHLVPRLDAAGNVELPMIFAGVPREERKKRVEKALESVGLSHRSKHRPNQLSGGERQRTAIARAVVMGPSILLADEPTGNLDSHSGQEIVELIEGMNRAGLTLIVVTHDPAIGERARRVIRMHDGEIELSSAGVSPA
ncbi:ABC transporter ATP-binding protein [bacterium]|nr:ABC transporter ATP-binding protein [bacterium]MCI0604768.1 ABC transporter ATP-binding protein [bacterium]